MSIIGFLITVLIILVVIYCTKIILDWCEVPGPIRTVALLIVALLCLLALLNQIGFVGAPLRVW